jgi:cyclic-di-AMP phosphodiesterase PgpH
MPFSLSNISFVFSTLITTYVFTCLVGHQLPQFIPIAAAALVVTIFFGRGLAIAITVVLLALSFGTADYVYILPITFASFAAIYAYSKQRHDLVFTGIIIGLAQIAGFIVSLVLWYSIFAATPLIDLVKLSVLEFAGGIVSAMIAIGSLPFTENLFGLLTPFRLNELTNSEQPLLRKLEMEAPGTYQHSLAVANLAEAGTHAVRGDVLLARAGALYHDLGKAADPKYFIENQLGEKNPHDDISPEESRAKVLAHVKNGVDLAHRYGLPKAIIDFIPMHQGTSVMAYFYHKACLRDGTENVDPKAYRYPGPKPQSKETAIVMLADVAEAVTHSMQDPSQEEIDEALTKVFDNRWQDGQLNQSTLTYEELQKVKTAFVRVWRTLHHERLKYPTTTTGKMPMPPHSVS